MRFTLIDQIVELRPGQGITARKTVSLAEEYLADHFPLFPVMPGVLMLEAMTQAAAWLLRYDDDFAHSIVVLKEARNIKYADFVVPGQCLTVTADLIKKDARYAEFKTQGMVETRVCVSARLTLERYNQVETNPEEAEMDAYNKIKMRKLFALLTGSRDVAAPVAVGEGG
jgi:3-hydroxyacyl-[acyl-carrier-protein] dehydratase